VAACALITGSSGLIGSHTIASWSVPGLDPVPVDRRRDDLLTPGTATSLIERLRPAVVVHLAWVASGTADYRTSADNERWVSASLEIEAACRDTDALLIATGSPLDRESASSDAYSAAKRALWRALEPAVTAGEIGWLRPFYVFDPTRRRPAVLEQAYSAATPLPLRTPHSRHDFIHAADVGRALSVAVAYRLSGEVPIGSGRLRTVGELLTAAGKSWTAAADPQPSPPQRHEAADIQRLTELGWTPSTTENFFRS
jgi:nucleoside-diphosphate-sugar epimerase